MIITQVGYSNQLIGLPDGSVYTPVDGHIFLDVIYMNVGDFSFWWQVENLIDVQRNCEILIFYI
jgi:hypothetical protein